MHQRAADLNFCAGWYLWNFVPANNQPHMDVRPPFALDGQLNIQNPPAVLCSSKLRFALNPAADRHTVQDRTSAR